MLSTVCGPPAGIPQFDGNPERVRVNTGDGLGSAAIGIAPLGVAVAAWQDSLSSEARVRAAIYADGSWRPVVTLATSLGRLESVTVGRPNAESVRWRRWSPERTAFFEADRRGLGWGAARARER